MSSMILERSMSPQWLSNTYLVAAGPGGDAFLVDAGGPMDPLFAKADEHGLTVTHVLLTRRHRRPGPGRRAAGRRPDRAAAAHARTHAGDALAARGRQRLHRRHA